MSSEVELLRDPLGAVVAGPETFASALAAQGVAVRRVDWRPSPSAAALGALWCDEVDAANRATSSASWPPIRFWSTYDRRSRWFPA